MERDEFNLRSIRALDFREDKENCLSSNKKSDKEFYFQPIRNLDFGEHISEISGNHCSSSNKKSEFHFRPIKHLDLTYKCPSPNIKSEVKVRNKPLTRAEKETPKLQKDDEMLQSKKKKRSLLTNSDTKSIKRRAVPIKVCTTPKAKKKLFQSSKIKTFKNSPKQLSRKATTPISIRSVKLRTTPKLIVNTPNSSTKTILKESIISTTPVRPKGTSTPLRSRRKTTVETTSNLNSSTAEFLKMEELCMSPKISSPLTTITTKFREIAVTQTSPGKKSGKILERLEDFNRVWEQQMRELERTMVEMKRVKQEFYKDCLAELQGCEEAKPGRKLGAGGLRVHTLRQNLQKSVKKFQI